MKQICDIHDNGVKRLCNSPIETNNTLSAGRHKNPSYFSTDIVFPELLEFNLNQNLLYVNHNIINIYLL